MHLKEEYEVNDEISIDKDLKDTYESLGMNLKSIHFKNQYLAGNLKLDNISDDYINEINSYYRQFTDKKINLKNHIVCKNVTGIEDVRIIPREVLRKDIIPFFNDKGMINSYTDKNFYDILFSEFNQPTTIIKNVRGHFFTNRNEHISPDDAKDILLNADTEYIIKSSDIENGRTIRKLKVDDGQFLINNNYLSFSELLSEYNHNFTIQKIIKQHDAMAKLHPYSVNTLRIVTLRWNNEINHLYTFCRFGVNKSIKDNAGQGGIVVGVKDNGEFMELGANRYKKVKKHPTTNILIKELDKVPNYDRCINLAKTMHKNILHQDFVSWDIAIEKNGDPIFIECNFYGSAIVNQIALERPLFGDLTDEILNEVYNKKSHYQRRDTVTEYSKLLRKYKKNRKELRKCISENDALRTKHNKFRNKQKRRIKKYQKRIDKRKQTIQNKNKEIESLKTKISSLENEISNIKNSRSWRYTSFLRKK